MLKVSLILMTIALAWGVMVLTSATQLGTDWLKKVGGLVLLAVIGTGYWARRTWSEIIRIEAEPTFRQKHRLFVLKASIAICAVLLVAAEEGIRVGRHVKRIETLTQQFEALALKSAATEQQFVQIARQATRTMPEYILRCSKLEAALNDYESNLRDEDRVLGQSLYELRLLKAAQRYAQLIAMFTVLQSLVRKELESAGAFRKEVDYAKQLATLATPGDQMRFYKDNILPIKSDEKRIAKEEIEILKHAKAHGVNLPESLYREAGIQ